MNDPSIVWCKTNISPVPLHRVKTVHMSGSRNLGYIFQASEFYPCTHSTWRFVPGRMCSGWGVKSCHPLLRTEPRLSDRSHISNMSYQWICGQVWAQCSGDSGAFTLLLPLNYGFTTRGPPGCIMRPAATFINYVYNTKITQTFRRLDMPLTVIFISAAHKPTHNNGSGPLP